MNAKQRRTANRTLNSLIGKSAVYVGPNGRARTVTIVGRTVPVVELGSCPTEYAFNGNKPSLHRVRCKRDTDTQDSHFSPRLSTLRIGA